MDTLYFLLSDKVIFPLFEVIFFGLFVFAVLRERGGTKKTGAIAIVKRGQESWNKLNLAFGLGSIVLMQVINSADALEGYKTIISTANLAMLVYLTFFNSWFRSKTIGIIIESQQKEERF